MHVNASPTIRTQQFISFCRCLLGSFPYHLTFMLHVKLISHPSGLPCIVYSFCLHVH